MIATLQEEPKRLWIEALRSEEFSQTKGALRNEDGYCCLGVLCEVAIKAGVKVEVAPPTDDLNAPQWAYDGEREFPPKAVLRWAFGVESPSLSVLAPDPHGEGDEQMEAELVELNDTGGWTFEQIADAVEEHL